MSRLATEIEAEEAFRHAHAPPSFVILIAGQAKEIVSLPSSTLRITTQPWKAESSWTREELFLSNTIVYASPLSRETVGVSKRSEEEAFRAIADRC